MVEKKKLFLDYGGLICNYDFTRNTLFRAHELALDYLNSQDGHRVNLNQLAQAHDKTIKSYLAARDKDHSEWPMSKIMDLLLSNLGLNGKISVSEVSKIYKLNDHDISPFPGTLETLTNLAKGRELGIISNLPHNSLIHELKRFDLYDLFETITISFQVGHRKPHPVIYQEALKRADVTPKEAAFVSHDDEEVIGARRLGIESLLVKSLKEAVGAI